MPGLSPPGPWLLPLVIILLVHSKAKRNQFFPNYIRPVQHHRPGKMQVNRGLQFQFVVKLLRSCYMLALHLTISELLNHHIIFPGFSDRF